MKIKGMLFILFAACVGHIGAMEPDKGTAEERLQRLIEEKLPAELQMQILATKINQLLGAQFPKNPSIEFIKSYLSLIAQFPMKYKKEYLNKFAKQWYLNYGKDYGKELKISLWTKRNFPGQTPEQVLYYGFSIQDYLDSPVLRKPQITLTNYGETKQLNWYSKRINNLHGLQNIPNIKTVQSLSLADNQLTTIQPNAFAGLPNLTTLKLAKNQLSTIPINAFAGLTNLTMLNLSSNQLKDIQPNAFAGLTNLTHLSLRYNQLKDIQPNAFAGLTNLRELNLANNQLNEKTKKAITKALEGRDVKIIFKAPPRVIIGFQ